MHNKYYQDELAYLREMGLEFSKAHPEAAHFVGEASNDPDVERLMEGFAFLTARIRQKLDDEIPELTHSLVEMFWPHYLRPVPSMTVVQFEALPQAAKEVRAINRGVDLQSVPVDGTACRFRTTYDVALQPISIESVLLKTEAPHALKVKFRVADGVSLKKTGLKQIRLHLAGDAVASRSLYLCLVRFLRRITVQASGGAPVALSGATIRPVGFAAEDPLLPFPATSFNGFRLLQEYFTFPAKFMFVNVAGLDGLAAIGDVSSFELTFELSRLAEPMPPVNNSNVLLHCTPAINLFSHEADPIRLDHERVEYRVRPAGGKPDHYEIYAIDKVAGLAQGAAKPLDYRPFLRFARGAGDNFRFYRQRLHPSVTADASEVFLSPMPPEGSQDAYTVETLSLDLTCSNRQLPAKLKVGDVSAATGTSPNFARFKNIVKPTASIPAPLTGDVHWKLLSHLALNYLSLVDVDALRRVVSLYHFRARVDRQAESAMKLLLDGIKRVSSAPATRLLQGSPIRGVGIEVDLDEDSFGGEG
ncbi:MAG: type VI secretion system baseplate subunit TssF, partial [Planctomycetota bacterium]